MTITFSFDNLRECAEVQEFFYNNRVINSGLLVNRPHQKFDIDLKGCMTSSFQIENDFLKNGLQIMGKSKFEIIADWFKIKNNNEE